VCLAVPGCVLSLDGATARVDFGGVVRTVMTPLVEDLHVGDYVLVHAGFAIQRLDPVEAAEVLALLGEAMDARSPDG
jgi:hydrogenase expression/formation protein HypC